jgi:hypothetical protein
MAAGAIPPPLFFERRRPRERKFVSRNLRAELREQISSRKRHSSETISKTSSVDHVLQKRPARYSCDFRIARSLPKDI